MSHMFELYKNGIIRFQLSVLVDEVPDFGVRLLDAILSFNILLYKS